MSWHFLQEQAAASWEGTCLDGAPSALLRLMPTRERSCSVVSATDRSRRFQSGMTFAPSMADLGVVASTSSPVDSLAKTSAFPVMGKALMGFSLDSGRKCAVSFTKFDPDSCSWRTAQHSLFGGLTEFLATWPRWGSMRNGECWERITSEEFINGKEYGFWPTPTRSPRDASCTMGTALKWDGKALQDSLSFAVARAEYKDGRHIPHGQLNPPWVEWLMDWPIGWTGCTALEMGRFHLWRQQHFLS